MTPELIAAAITAATTAIAWLAALSYHAGRMSAQVEAITAGFSTIEQKLDALGAQAERIAALEAVSHPPASAC